MRYYNGQPDKALQAVLDFRERTRAAIKALGYWPTYFPEGEFYQAFDAQHRPVGPECKSLESVLWHLQATDAAIGGR